MKLNGGADCFPQECKQEMKPEDTLAALTHFFNDFIGAIVPGFSFLFGLFLIHPTLQHEIFFDNSLNTSSIIAILVLSFASGHFLLSVHSVFVEPFLAHLPSWRTEADQTRSTEKSFIYKEFLKLVLNRLSETQEATSDAPTDKINFRDLRNVAMSLSSSGASLARRFTHISLLCNGLGTAMMVLAGDLTLCRIALPNLIPYHSSRFVITAVIILLGSSYALLKRAEIFSARALKIPFSVALSEAIFLPITRDGK